LAAGLSYCVAARRHCLILLKKRSARLRAAEIQAEANRINAPASVGDSVEIPRGHDAIIASF
jgi:hypothetical protein